MGLGNTPRRTTVVSLEARKSFALGLNFKRASSGVALDLTGASVRMVIAQPQHRGGAVVLTKTATVIDATAGSVQIELQASELDLAAGEYPFDVSLVSANSYTSPVLKGVVDVRDNVDPDTTGTYTGINPSTQLAVSVEQGDVVEVYVDKIDGMYVIVSTMIADFSAQMDAKVLAAGTAEDNAASWAGAAADSAANASNSELAAAQSVTDAAAEKSAAQTAAANSATSASQSATSASTATTKAAEAAASATDAASSAAAAQAAAAEATGGEAPVIAANEVTFTSGTGLSAGNVKAALDELDTEKAASGHTHDYAPTVHTHDYAPTVHTHDYAPTVHTHDDRYYTEAEIDAKLGSGTAQADFGRMVLTSFDNAEMRARFYVSEDAGLSFTALPGSTIYADPDATKAVRDASFERVGGKYLMAYTRAPLADPYFGACSDWGLAVSDDLLSFEHLVTVNPGLTIERLWAPDLFVDGETVYCYFATRVSGGQFKIHVQTADISDLTTWSAPVEMTGLGTNIIDFTVKRDGNGGYAGIIKSDTVFKLWAATADSPLGPWTLIEPELPGPAPEKIEGPSLFRTPAGKWRVVYDVYESDRMEFMESDDLITWSAATVMTRPATNLRHPGILWLSHAEDRALQAKWDLASRVPAGGSTGQALIKASAADHDVTWGTVASGGGAAPAKRVTLSKAATQAIAMSTWTDVTWDTEEEDTDGAWVSGADITVPAGVTKVKANLSLVWNNLTSGERFIRIKRVSDDKMIAGDIRSSRNETFTTVSSPWVPVVAGDVLRVAVHVTSTSAAEVQGGGYGGPTRITVEWE